MALHIGKDGQVERRPYDGFPTIPQSHRRKAEKGPLPRKPRPAPRQVADPCGVSRGELTSWEHCECFACLTKQMRVLERELAQARRREGIKP
jgi:hypothetical protein